MVHSPRREQSVDTDRIASKSESRPLSFELEAKIEGEDCEPRVKVSLPKFVQGHSSALEFFQNREPTTRDGPFLIEHVLTSEFLIHEEDSAVDPVTLGYSYLKLGKPL